MAETGTERSARRLAIRILTTAHLLAQRLSHGRLGGRIAGMPVLLLTTTGRRTGRPRTTPLTFFRDGPELVVIASNGGSDRAPSWSLNLRATPAASVRIGGEQLSVVARVAS